VQGWVRFNLMEKSMNATGSHPMGNYTVTAKYENHEAQESVNITGNQQITITLSFIVPQFPTLLLLLLFIAIITTIAVVLRKLLPLRPKRYQNQSAQDGH